MAATAPAEGREVLGAPSLGDRLKLGFQGLAKSIEKSASAASSAVVTAEGETGEVQKDSSKDGIGVDKQVSALFNWAKKAGAAVADKVTYDAVQQDEPRDDAGDDPDVEKGEAKASLWAKAASAVKKQVATAAEEANKNLKQGVQKVQNADWSEPASMVSKSVSGIAASATSASSALQEKGKAASQKALQVKDKTAEKLNEAKSSAGQAANKAKDKASAAAGAAKSKLSEAGQSVAGAAGGVGALAMNPVKLAQFVAIFFVGCMLITLSFSFLPVLVIAPQKFALLFAFGSLVIMGSLAFLKGPKALASQLMQREKLPFSSAYIVGLVGTLVATIVLRSFILTAVFGVIQAVSLMYFLASYVPGGKAVLNFCGRCSSRLTQKVICSSCKCPGTK